MWQQILFHHQGVLGVCVCFPFKQRVVLLQLPYQGMGERFFAKVDFEVFLSL